MRFSNQLKPGTKLSRLGRWRLWIIVTVFLAITAVTVDYYTYPLLSRTSGRSFNKSENGLWLRYTWYFGKWNHKDLGRLVERLHKNKIRFAYFHVRSVGEDGRLKFRYASNAHHLVKALHKDAPDIKAIAWVYIGNSRGRGSVDLGKAAVRKAITEESLWLVDECGFDGVQIDYEICKDGDPDFLRLIRETRKTFPRDKVLSVATPLWLPGPFLRWGGWSADYFVKVAANCDQMAVMCYDSAAYFPRAYVWLLRQQAIQVTQAAVKGNPKGRVLFGLPTYNNGTPSHNPHSENIRLALKGIREGLTDRAARPEVCAGVALFADHTTQRSEWQAYRERWLGAK